MSGYDPRRTIALRGAWYAAVLVVPTLALAWAGDDRRRWVWVVALVACLTVASSPRRR